VERAQSRSQENGQELKLDRRPGRSVIGLHGSGLIHSDHASRRSNAPRLSRPTT
jgi:hypothetical protein